MLYLDSSALVKLYVREMGTEETRALAGAEEYWLCHDIGYVEVRAALAAAERLGRLSTQARVQAATRFREDWHGISRVAVDPELMERAADLAEGLALRGYDAVHLAAADRVRLAAGKDLVFLSFDRVLNRAARLLGLHLAGFAPC